MSFYYQLIVNAVIGILHAVIKNPKSVATEGKIISDLAQVATEADTAVNGTIWRSGKGTPGAAIPDEPPF